MNKRKPIFVPWWKRRPYKHVNKTDYYLRVCEFLESAPVDKSLTLKVRRLRVHR